MSRRQSIGVAGTQLTAALNVSKIIGTGKAHPYEFVFLCVFVFVFAKTFMYSICPPIEEIEEAKSAPARGNPE